MKIQAPKEPQDEQTLVKRLLALPKWIWVIVSAFLMMFIIIGCSGGNGNPKTVKKAPSTAKIDSSAASSSAAAASSMLAQKNADEATSLLASVHRPLNQTGRNTIEMTKRLTKIFTIYQDVPKRSDALLGTRAKKLVPYMSTTALNTLIPKSAITSENNSSIVPQSKLTGPVDVKPIHAVSGAYQITVEYRSFADDLKHSTSDHKDQYIVDTDQNKIIALNQTSAMTE